MVTCGGEFGNFDRWTPDSRVSRESMCELREEETRGQRAMIGMAAPEVGSLKMRSYRPRGGDVVVRHESVHDRNGQVRGQQEGQEGRPGAEGLGLKHPSIDSHLPWGCPPPHPEWRLDDGCPVPHVGKGPIDSLTARSPAAPKGRSVAEGQELEAFIDQDRPDPSDPTGSHSGSCRSRRGMRRQH
jgi:hypothetical protein